MDIKLLDSTSQQVSFSVPAELVAHLAPYAKRLEENRRAEGLEYFHLQRMELRGNALLTYDQWHATDFVKAYREALAQRVDPVSLPYYRHLAALYEEYKVAFKTLHGHRPGRAFRKPPGKASFAWALGQALMDHARCTVLKLPPLKIASELREEAYYVAQSSPDAQIARLLEEGLLPLHKLRHTKNRDLEKV